MHLIQKSNIYISITERNEIRIAWIVLVIQIKRDFMYIVMKVLPQVSL